MVTGKEVQCEPIRNPACVAVVSESSNLFEMCWTDRWNLHVLACPKLKSRGSESTPYTARTPCATLSIHASINNNNNNTHLAFPPCLCN